MEFVKRGRILAFDQPNSWWYSHTMAPTAILWKDRIRVFIGAWDRNGISRISYVDLDQKDPGRILHVHDAAPVLDIGMPGCFDDNGVFPGHASVFDNKIHLYYTGFQLGDKIAHFTFGGLAISSDGEHFERVSEAPILDRADEGLLVRSGQSVIYEDDCYKSVYSVGNHFVEVGGKARPSYDVCYLESLSTTDFAKKGQVIVKHDPELEHGLGRPQLIRIGERLYVIYTRRMLNMKYFMGAAWTDDGIHWQKDEALFAKLIHPEQGWDSEMIYFPTVVQVPELTKTWLFYSGNHFGETGFGYAELVAGNE